MSSFKIVFQGFSLLYFFFSMNTFFKGNIWMAASELLSYSFAQYEQKEEY